MTSILPKRVGFLLASGFRPAQVIGVQGVLGLIPLNRCQFIAASREPVPGMAGYTIVPSHTYEEARELDVVVVPEHGDVDAFDDAFVAALRAMVGPETIVLAISNGAVALDRAGLGTDAAPGDDRDWTVEGKTFVAGPSTGALAAAFVILERLRGRALARYAELNLEYDPQNRFPDQPGSDAGVLSGLAPLRVAVLTSPYTYAPDPVGALDVLHALPGTDVRYVWKEPGPVPTLLGPRIVADTSFDSCPDVDVICIGATAPAVIDDPDVAAFLRSRFSDLRAAITTCAGVLVLGGAGLLTARTATSNFHMTGLLAEAGVTPSHDTVVADGKVYTAGPAVGSYEAALLAVADIHGPQVASYIEHQVLRYRPNAPQQVGSPSKAGRLLTGISRAPVVPINVWYRRSLRRGYRANAPTATADL